MKLHQMIGRSVSVYLADTEAPFEGYFQGTDEGFLMLTARNDPNAEVSFIDRDSVWCITAADATQEITPS